MIVDELTFGASGGCCSFISLDIKDDLGQKGECYGIEMMKPIADLGRSTGIRFRWVRGWWGLDIMRSELHDYMNET